MQDSTIIRGSQQISVWNMPDHGNVITDTDGRKWTVKMNGGVMLRDGKECHPDFVDGPKDAWQFAAWINSAFI